MYTSVKLVHVPPSSGNVTLEYLNEELFQLHIPALTFMVVSMVIGIIGNALVLIVYKTKFRRSNHRYFILFLAFFDFLASAVGTPFLVSSLRLPYMMDSAVVCKTMRYVSYTINNSSGLLLLIVSIERYRKICRPFKKQLSSRQILYLCCGVATISAILAIPAPVFYGASTIDTGVGNITGTQCYVEDARKGSPFFELFMLVLLVEAILCISAFIILYVFIIRKLLASDVFLSTMRSIQATMKDGSNDHTNDSLSMDNVLDADESSSSGNCSGSSNKTSLNSKGRPLSSNSIGTGNDISPTADTVDISQSEHFTCDSPDYNGVDNQEKTTKRPKSDVLGHRVNSKGGSKVKEDVQKWNTITPTQKLVYGNIIKGSKAPKKGRASNKSTRSSSHSKTTNRVTIMLMMVSFVFAISFIPHLVLMILAAHSKGFLENMNSTEIITFQVFLRTFVLNNIANPLIYLYCDSKFRKSCSEIVRCKFRINKLKR